MDVSITILPTASWTVWVAALAAVSPALIIWRLYAPLLRRLDDPVLPERMFSRRAPSFGLLFGGAASVVWTWPAFAIWTLPLMFLAWSRVVYGVRRTVLGENLTFSGYLRFVLRFTIAWPGFWALLAAAPAIVFLAGNYGPLVAIVLGIALVLWHGRFREVFLWTLGATPLDREDLPPHFAPLFDKTELAAPRLYQTGAPGGVFANAFALPSFRGASVVFTRTLIERLSAEEIAAVLGHELGHLEQFTPTRLRREFILTLLQIVAAICLVPLLIAFAASTVGPAVSIAWPLFVVVTLRLRRPSVHATELACDRRAIELSGNPDAMASALSKLNAIARHPTRWPATAASHPSLAQRLRAIRDIAGQPSPRLTEPVLIDGFAPGVCVIFDATAVRVLTDVPAATPRVPDALVAHAAVARRFAYDTLRTCAIAAIGTAPAALALIDREGQRTVIALRDEDVPCVQDTLDRIDAHISAPPTPVSPMNLRVAAFLVFCISLLAGPIWSVALVASLALLRPTMDVMLAAALMTIASGLLHLANPAVAASVSSAGLMIAAGLLVLMLMLAQRVRQTRYGDRRRPEHEQPRADARARQPERRRSGISDEDFAPAWGLTIVVAAAIATWAIVMLTWDGGMLRLVQTVRDSSSVVVLPFGAAVLVAGSRMPVRARWTAASALLLVALVPAAMIPLAFQERVIRDPLLGEMPELPRVAGNLTLINQTESTRGDVIRVSPSARSVATGWAEDEHDWEAPLTAFAIHTADGRVEQIAANDVQFVDDEKALVLRRSSPGLELVLHMLTPAASPASETTLLDPRAKARRGARRSAVTIDPAAGHVAAGGPATADGASNGAGAAGAMSTGAASAGAASAGAGSADSVSAGSRSGGPASASAASAGLETSHPLVLANASASGVTGEWKIQLPDFETGRLSVDPRTGRWRVAGRDPRGALVRVQGILGNEIVEEARWTAATAETGEVFFDSSRAVIGVQADYPAPLLSRFAPRMASVLASAATTLPSPDVSLWRIGSGEKTPERLVGSEAMVDCHEPVVNAGTTVCFAYDGVATRIWSLDAEHGALIPIGQLHGYARALSRGLDGSVLVWWQQRALIVHVRSPRAIELSAGAIDATRWDTGAYTAGHLVVFSRHQQAPSLSTYRFVVEERTPATTGVPTRAAVDRDMLQGR